MEKDNDMSGGKTGAVYDYGFRIYDARIAKFLSVDPLFKSYPWYTPYQYAGNYPILTRDIDGLEPEVVLNTTEQHLGKPYEYGAKNPVSQILGWKKNESIKPMLRAIHNSHSDSWPDDEVAINQDFNDWRDFKQLLYALNGLDIPKGSSVGIDCSGLTKIALNSDKEIIMQNIRDGSLNQLADFRSAASKKQAYLHKNAKLVSKGDWVKASHRHVMIATGNVRTKDGQFQFQVHHAKGVADGVTDDWITDDGSYTFGHPFRTSDETQTEEKGFLREYNPKERTENNLIQTDLTNEN